MRLLPKPTFFEEQTLWKMGHKHIAGADEVGRGAFAGPVVAAAVILPVSFPRINEIHDSKLLTPIKRAELSLVIKEYAIAFGIGEVPVRVINQIGVGKAAWIAFRKAIKCLTILPDFLLMDGFLLPRFNKKKQKAIIHGDRISVSIAAASIIAKVYRDEKMEKYAELFNTYGFKQHKGYGTKLHRENIQKYGLCKLHRTSFDLSDYTSHIPKTISHT